LIGGQQGDTRVLEPLLEAATAELARPGVLVPVSSLRRWKTRRVLRRAAEAEDYLRRCWERLRGAPGLFESYRHRDIGFADLASRDLERILLGHLPTAVRRLEVAIEMLDALGPATVLLSGWPRDDRRTLLTACAVAGVPAAVVHLGAVRSEELDREDGGPRAKATFAWTLGANLGPVLARLGEPARARVERE
jgi:hypothetical protein